MTPFAVRDAQQAWFLPQACALMHMMLKGLASAAGGGVVASAVGVVSASGLAPASPLAPPSPSALSLPACVPPHAAASATAHVTTKKTPVRVMRRPPKGATAPPWRPAPYHPIYWKRAEGPAARKKCT